MKAPRIPPEGGSHTTGRLCRGKTTLDRRASNLPSLQAVCLAVRLLRPLSRSAPFVSSTSIVGLLSEASSRSSSLPPEGGLAGRLSLMLRRSRCICGFLISTLPSLIKHYDHNEAHTHPLTLPIKPMAYPAAKSRFCSPARGIVSLLQPPGD